MHGSQTARRTWEPLDEPGFGRVAKWPYLRRETKEFWATVSKLAREAGRASGTLEELAVALGSNKTSVRDHARRLESLGLMAIAVHPDGRWQLTVCVPDLAAIPSAAEARAAAGRSLPKRLRCRGEATGQKALPLTGEDDGAALSVVFPDSSDHEVSQREPVPDVSHNGNPFPMCHGTGSRSGTERERVPVVKPPETASPPGEPAVETPRACSSRAALQIPKKTKNTLPNHQVPTNSQSTSKDSAPSRRDAESRRAGSWDPPSLAEAAAEATRANLEQMCHPADQACRLVERILATVPELRPRGVYLARWAARLVCFENRLYPADVDGILGDVAAMREAATPEKPFEPGAFFNFKLRQLTQDRGIPWQPVTARRPQQTRGP